MTSSNGADTPTTKPRTYTRHGVHRVMKAVRAQGLDGIDKRSGAWKAVERFRDALLEDLGGAGNVSTQQAALVDLASRCWLYLNHIDGFLMTQDRLIVGRGRKQTVLPVLQQRQGIATHFESLMGRLGIQRTPKPLPSLASYLESKRMGDATEEKADG